MFKGLLNLDKILGTSRGNTKSFQKFILGNNSSISSIASKAAANNIVKFNFPNVKANSGSSNLLLNNISTNILNTVNNSFHNVIEGVQSTVNNYIGNISSKVDTAITSLQEQIVSLQTQLKDGFIKTVKQVGDDYKIRLSNLEERSPSRILEAFIKVYQNAIGFVNFFGDSRNISKLTRNLKSLRNIFNDSFEVAKVIRQTIRKIVNQLTNLPSASGASGKGLNVDIAIPGGALKRSGGSKLGNMMRMGGKLGLGALGIGAVGMGVPALASALTPAKEYQQRKLEESKAMRDKQPSILDEVADTFTKAVDKFTNIISKAFGGSDKAKSSGSSSGASSSSSTPSSSPGSPNDASQLRTSNVGSPEEQALLKTIRHAEGTKGSYGTIFGGGVVPELAKGELTVKEVYDMMNSGTVKGRRAGYASGSAATGAYQFMPDTLKGIVNAGIIKWGEKFTPEVQDKAGLYLMNMRGVTSDLLKKEGGLTQKVSSLLAPEWASFPTASGSSYYPDQSVKNLGELKQFYSSAMTSATTAITTTTLPSTTSTHQQTPAQTAENPKNPPRPKLNKLIIPPPEPSKVSAATTSTGSSQGGSIAEAVRDSMKLNPKVPEQLPPSINYIPLPETNFIDATTNSSGGGSPMIVPSEDSGGSGPSVPLLSSSNPDNFYIHLSALTLNLVNR